MSWRYGPGAGTLGMILVSPAQQGKGIGRRLTEALLHDAGARSLMLNATGAGLRLYAASGFRVAGAIRQLQGQCRSMSGATAARPLRPGDRAALLALDAAAFGAERTTLLDRLIQEGRTMVLGAPQAVTGFAIRRKFGRGEVIGPVVAASETDAIELVSALAGPRLSPHRRSGDGDLSDDLAGRFRTRRCRRRHHHGSRRVAGRLCANPTLRPGQPGARLAPPLAQFGLMRGHHVRHAGETEIVASAPFLYRGGRRPFRRPTRPVMAAGRPS